MWRLFLIALIAALPAARPAAAQILPQFCQELVGDFCVSHARDEFPLNDFETASIDLADILSGGPRRDGIPPIDRPQFVGISGLEGLSDTEPVVGLTVGGEWKAYPLQVLMWHEIANDEIGGVPVAVTFCPLCNAVIVFDRRAAGRTLDFGTTGRLRNSDLLMYDRQTETWWQQFLGEAIVGELTGTRLEILPARLESFAEFRDRAPADAQVLVPADRRFRAYGANPYEFYDTMPRPFLYRGEVPDGIAPLARVVSLTDRARAWSMDLLREQGRITAPDGTVLTWRPGQNSALDAPEISDGRDVGTVTATRDGQDVPYFVDFAFAFHAFHPQAEILTP